MRLLNVHTFRFEEHHNELDVPPYVVASHRWQAGTEAMIDDIEHQRNTETKGYQKVEGFAKYIREHIAGVNWLWMDTCCVTQHSTKEVDEAVRSMFRWYANAHVCLAYLADVVDPCDKHEFDASQWHRRGWTLQELLAPQLVIFLSRTWNVIGHKLDKRCTNMPTLDVGPSLVPAIAEVARIPESVLYSYEQSGKLTVEEKLTWTVGRDTTKGEDMYYSLLGIFSVDMRLSYGEGRVEAKARLLKKIAKSAQRSDPSSFAAKLVQQPWLTPRKANPQYKGYRYMLDYLERYILLPDDGPPDREQTVVVLSGMGGVGKSETILHFLDTNRKEIRERLWAVFWIDCSSDTAARADFRRISNLYAWGLADDEVIDGVKDRLASSSTPSLLVLDNCDDGSIDYSRYIPSGDQVNVVLTTRLADAGKYASRDSQNKNNKLFKRMEGLDVSSAVELLLDVSETQEHDGRALKEATRIVTAVGFHPLAITVAGSLIQGGEYSLRGYAGALEKQTKSAQGDLLDSDNEQAQYRNISATFDVSAQALAASSDPSAKHALELLDMIAFMHHQGISEGIFVRAWEYEEHVLFCRSEQGEFKYADEQGKMAEVEFEGPPKKKLRTRASNKVLKTSAKDQGRPITPDLNIRHLTQWHATKCRTLLGSQPLRQRLSMFRKARKHLARLSLITVEPNIEDPETMSISFHLLVRAWAGQRNLQQYEAWLSAACVLALSTEGSAVWQPFSAELEPHLIASFSSFASSLGPYSELDHSHRRQICRIWYIYAWQLERVGSPLTVDCCERLLEQTKALAVNGGEDEQVTEAQYLLAVGHRRNGRVEDALKLLEHVVQVEGMKLAEDHPARLASQHALASAYLSNRQVAAAIELFEHVVRVKERSLAEDHPSRLVSQHELAGAYLEDGQVARGMTVLEHVVRIRGRSLVEDHPERLVSQHELASAYLANGQVAQAVELLEHVVQVQERMLAEDHSNRLTCQHGLAGAYLKNGQTVRAVELLEHVVRVGERSVVEDHPHLLVSQHELARAYWGLDRYQEALDLIQHVVRVKQIALRADHPERIRSEVVLAKMQEDMAALEVSEQAETSNQDQAESESEWGDVESEEDADAGAEAGD
ncbi:hypothetical protein LTR17_000859 [Elasticomyces elasticus]|nr:hypothetical protein LTR17_000859 [Elasticomyces elasticus]